MRNLFLSLIVLLLGVGRLRAGEAVREITFLREVIDAQPPRNPWFKMIGDLDGNGRLDVVGRDQSAFGKAGNALYIYRQAGLERRTKWVIAWPHGEGIQVADLTGNGRPDIVIGGRCALAHSAYENH